jgi:ribosome-binding ATPase YchF (GTP1/OBG family)
MTVMIRESYRLLGLISFFTVGEDEVRAWTIKSSTRSVDAAEAIHSDIKKGFIRAEVVAYDDLIESGSYVEAKKRGLVRLEGKEYVVQDGDVMEFRFSV